MKKIIIITLLLCIFLLSGCSKDYQKMYDEIKYMELKNTFENEEEIKKFLSEVQDNFNSKLNFKLKSKLFYFEKENDESDILALEKREITAKFQKENNKLISKYKTFTKIQQYERTEKFICYYKGKQEYINNLSTEEKYANYIGDYELEKMLNGHMKRPYYNTFFIDLYENDFIEKIGEDEKGNIVIIVNYKKESVSSEIEKLVFKNKQIIEFEYIRIGYHNGYAATWHLTEKYSYSKNIIRYPNFDKYKIYYGG